MGAARWIRFAVLMCFAGLFLWVFYARYMKRGLMLGGDLLSAGALWIVLALLFGFLAFATLKRS